MQYNRLGTSSLRVSQLCLGTMTWGQQNSEREAHEQLDVAVNRGINFIDTAEIYPMPPNQETQGLAEKFLGSWLARTGMRDHLVIATKVVGSGDVGAYEVREKAHLDLNNIKQALNDSLERLQTNYIDLYLMHWPERPTNYFGRLGYEVSEEDQGIEIKETLEALKIMVDKGKIRYIGICNETPWGVMEYLRMAERHQLPKIICIQNPYNLLNRSYEVGLAEFAHRENLPLMAYSPLAFGVLTGKYLNQQRPEAARVSLYPYFTRYMTENGVKATELYVEIADKYGLTPVQLALSFVKSQPFIASTIVGATTIEQLKENIKSIEIDLPNSIYDDIEEVNRKYTYPCP